MWRPLESSRFAAEHSTALGGIIGLQASDPADEYLRCVNDERFLDDAYAPMHRLLRAGATIRCFCDSDRDPERSMPLLLAHSELGSTAAHLNDARHRRMDLAKVRK